MFIVFVVCSLKISDAHTNWIVLKGDFRVNNVPENLCCFNNLHYKPNATATKDDWMCVTFLQIQYFFQDS